jgi:hypothetical protein
MKEKPASPMKPNESDVAIEHEQREAELPDLAVRILSDFARIVAAEARLLEANIVGAAQTFLDRVYIASTLVVLSAAGVVAVFASLALLLHQWMRWWQVLGLVGMSAIAVAEVLRRSLIPPPASEPGISLENRGSATESRQ